MSIQEPTFQATNDAPAPFSTAALFVGATVLGSLFGVSVPEAGETISQGIDATLRLMIFLLLFELRLGAVFKAFSNARFLAVAFSANFLIIPFIGSGVASLFFADAPLLFAALMIYFLAPCTDWFLGFTRMAKGDTVLGAALIPINMITQLLLFPIWLWLLTRSSGLVDLGTLPNMLFEWFLLPLLAAQAFRLVLERFTPSKTAEQFFSFANRLVPYVLAALIVQIFATHSGTISASPGIFVTVAQAVCAFFAATLLVGATLSRLAGLDHPQHALLAMTMTARNAPLMLALTAVAVPDQPLVLAVIVSAMLVEMPLLTALRELLLFRARIR